MSNSGLAPIHPGEFLAEILAELGISQAEFARAIGVSAMRVSHVVNGSRPVTAELALLFGKAFDQSPEYWLNLQSAFDLATARNTVGRRLRDTQRLGKSPDLEISAVSPFLFLRGNLVGAQGLEPWTR